MAEDTDALGAVPDGVADRGTLPDGADTLRGAEGAGRSRGGVPVLKGSLMRLSQMVEEPIPEPSFSGAVENMAELEAMRANILSTKN
jgi:hypothetical protein